MNDWHRVMNRLIFYLMNNKLLWQKRRRGMRGNKFLVRKQDGNAVRTKWIRKDQEAHWLVDQFRASQRSGTYDSLQITNILILSYSHPSHQRVLPLKNPCSKAIGLIPLAHSKCSSANIKLEALPHLISWQLKIKLQFDHLSAISLHRRRMRESRLFNHTSPKLKNDPGCARFQGPWRRKQGNWLA